MLFIKNLLKLVTVAKERNWFFTYTENILKWSGKFLLEGHVINVKMNSYVSIVLKLHKLTNITLSTFPTTFSLTWI